MKNIIIEAYLMALTLIVTMIAIIGLIIPGVLGIGWSPLWLLLYLIEPLLWAFAVRLIER